MDYRKEEIEEYFKTWVMENGTHHLKIVKFLQDHKDLSDTKSTDHARLDTCDLVHQEAFPTAKPIIENPTAAKAFLASEVGIVRRLVIEWEQERYGDLTDPQGNEGLATDISDDVALVNRYFFIPGEDIVAKWMEDPIYY